MNKLEKEITNLSISLLEFMVEKEILKVHKTALKMAKIEFGLLEKNKYVGKTNAFNKEFIRTYHQYAHTELFQLYHYVKKNYVERTSKGEQIKGYTYPDYDTVNLMFEIKEKLEQEDKLPLKKDYE